MGFQSKWRSLQFLWRLDNRYQVILARLLFRRWPVITYQIGRFHLLVNSRDPGGLHECLFTGMYGDILSRLDLPPQPVVIDLGGNEGGFVLRLLMDGYRPSRVVTVEMNPNTFHRLRYNILRNQEGDSDVIWAAVTGRNGTKRLHFDEGTSMDSITGSLSPAEGRKAYSVPLRTLDSLYREHCLPGFRRVDLLKMDVEGAEFGVLLGPECRQCLRNCRYLLLEIHPDQGHVDRLLRRIHSLGFQTLEGSWHPDVHAFVNKRLT
jgi:FkbM family methyltransferase